MANKDALRALQTRLAERMQQVRSEQPGVSWLAVDCGGQGLLFPLKEAGEIFDTGTMVAVPHTQPWFSGVVNLRGGVCSVVDMASFLGLREAGGPLPEHARLVAFNAALNVNGALLVDRLEGLRHAADMQATEETDDNASRPAFAPARWRDAAGREWQEISLAGLAHEPQFLAIAG
ncbi:chemotaxis protein CheW [Aquabacterium sp. OR-4]|uniref:chemotaxis protein CheW n=1 Tax=Aquabacterium sp. OR-4 TaxID=2978127 RepID=UPI0021B1E178|nr:chemotaxis protein CheW [Aquabacterium sp. OR-4]MDT7834412.1 chemotaxis protein CheW [Aquabacterium sp. OR-4]